MKKIFYKLIWNFHDYFGIKLKNPRIIFEKMLGIEGKGIEVDSFDSLGRPIKHRAKV